MPDSEPDPNKFTDRENYILSYYRERDLSGARSMTLYDIMVGIASLVCLIYGNFREDQALAFVAYGLLFTRLAYIVIEGGKWTKDFQSIFRKYDARLKLLTEAQR